MLGPMNKIMLSVYNVKSEPGDGSRSLPDLTCFALFYPKKAEEKSYHGIIPVTSQNDDVNRRGMIGHTDATISRPVFPTFRM